MNDPFVVPAQKLQHTFFIGVLQTKTIFVKMFVNWEVEK